jgi:hypothetical protein
MPTYTLIMPAVVVGAGGAASIDFSSIPSTYTDLVLVGSLRSSNSNNYGDVFFTFNGATTNRTARYLEGSGSAAASGTQTTMGAGSGQGNSATANTFGNFQLYIPNYAGSTNKSSSADGVGENNATQAYATLTANLWSQTTAINQISILPLSTFVFQQYSTAYLYGVSNA